ncbi:MAG: hypothetical protein GXP15_05175 [Gammaproteobacteria bacterium]|nr:hypothetical protein [Gammaproteobacteria bacterium]
MLNSCIHRPQTTTTIIDKMQPSSIHLYVIGLLLTVIGSMSSAQADTGESPLFDHQSTLHIRIEGPLSTLIKKRSNSDYLDGKLSYTDDSGSTHEFDLKFRTRGNYRRERTTCNFPPVRLNLQKKQVLGTEFSGQNILKLVSPCKPTTGRYEQYILKEYLAYKILQLHTPYSFRTRLLKITWIDTDKRNPTFEKYAFVIEHKSELANRLSVTIPKIPGTRHSRLNRTQAGTASVFQYLIGNTDFSLVKGASDDACCHNGILVSKDGDTFFPVPYDFDFAGLVNASYAEPHPTFRLGSVTKRLYRGHCSVNAELAPTIAMFAQKKDAVFELVETQEGLSNRERMRTLNFIGKFYAELDNPQKIRNKFARKCF